MRSRTAGSGFISSYNDFIRTTEAAPCARSAGVLRAAFGTRVCVQGHVYEGWYSVSDETFFRDTDIDEERGVARETGQTRAARSAKKTTFLSLSAFGDRLLAHIEANPTPSSFPNFAATK